MQDSLGFALALLAILSVPGPTNTLLATSGATVGLRRSLSLLPYELLGYASAIIVIRALIAPALTRLPGQARLLHALAAVYLVALAVGLWRWRLAHATRAVRAGHVLFTTLLNPKALFIALVLIPVDASVQDRRYWPVLVTLIPAVGTAWIGLGSLLGGAAPRGLTLAIPKAASLILGMFALLLIVSALR